MYTKITVHMDEVTWYMVRIPAAFIFSVLLKIMSSKVVLHNDFGNNLYTKKGNGCCHNHYCVSHTLLLYRIQIILYIIFEDLVE